MNYSRAAVLIAPWGSAAVVCVFVSPLAGALIAVFAFFQNCAMESMK